VLLLLFPQISVFLSLDVVDTSLEHSRFITVRALDAHNRFM